MTQSETFRVLLTGFNPFADNQVNPAQKVVERMTPLSIPGIQLDTLIIPTEWEASAQHLQSKLDNRSYDLVVMLGLAATSQTIRLETTALNINRAKIPDNAGEVRNPRLIQKDGPPLLQSGLPIETLQQKLTAKGFPVSISDHAGTYVCNHLYYHALSHPNAKEALFVHIPSTEDCLVAHTVYTKPIIASQSIIACLTELFDALR